MGNLFHLYDNSKVLAIRITDENTSRFRSKHSRLRCGMLIIIAGTRGIYESNDGT
jgi:hypothetical protein